MASNRPTTAFVTGLLVAVATACATAPDPGPILLSPDRPAMNRRAPEHCQVRLATTKGTIVIELHRDWSPLGVDRFYNLASAGYYDGVRFHRVIAGKWAQFGIHGEPEIAQFWRHRRLADEPRRTSNVRGTIAYAFAEQNGRTTQLFINLRDNSASHDEEPFVPIGRIVMGMDVVDALNTEYGETAGGGIRGGRQDPLFEGGNDYLDANYPRLDSILHAVMTK